jgi:hypothetical protein
MVQKSKQKNKTKNQKEYTDLSSHILCREAKENLLSKSWSKAILQDVSIYENEKYWDDYGTKIIKLTISSPDEQYQDDFILGKYTNDLDVLDPVNIFKNLRNKKVSYISVGYLPGSRNVIRIDKSIEKSKLYSMYNNIFHIMFPYIIGVLFWLLFTYVSFEIYKFSNLNIFDTYLSQILIIPISLLFYELAKRKTNKTHFEIKQPNDMDDISESDEISKSIPKDESNEYDFISSKGTIKSFNNGKIIINSKEATWTFEPEDGVISDDIVQLYTDYGGQFDHGDSIPIRVSKYKNTELGDDMFLSDCSKWILKSNTL